MFPLPTCFPIFQQKPSHCESQQQVLPRKRSSSHAPSTQNMRNMFCVEVSVHPFLNSICFLPQVFAPKELRKNAKRRRESNKPIFIGCFSFQERFFERFKRVTQESSKNQKENHQKVSFRNPLVSLPAP